MKYLNNNPQKYFTFNHLIINSIISNRYKGNELNQSLSVYYILIISKSSLSLVMMFNYYNGLICTDITPKTVLRIIFIEFLKNTTNYTYCHINPLHLYLQQS